jgi:hypothetical protein
MLVLSEMEGDLCEDGSPDIGGNMKGYQREGVFIKLDPGCSLGQDVIDKGVSKWEVY